MTPEVNPGEIPAAVRARDLVGYGRNAPGISWPGGAKVVINLVLVYEAGSEYSVAWGDDRNDGWGEYADPGVQPPQRDPGTEAHYEFGSRAGVWRLARIFDAAEVPVTVSAAAVALELNPGVAEWMRERDHDVLGHGWRWTEAWTYTREEERALIVRAIETFERVLGYRPIGWNSRGWPSENTREHPARARWLPLPLRGLRRRPAVLRGRRRRAADPRDPVLEDLQRLALPHEPGLREPARLPRDDGLGPRRAGARGRRAADDDDGRSARALERPGRARLSAAPVHRARAGHRGRELHAPLRHRELVARAVPAPVRAGFVGAGAISEFHLALLAGDPAVTVTAICDADEARAQTVAERTGARAFGDWRELLAAGLVDVLFVCTPPLHHAAPAIAALERGIPVYLEKPLARTRADGEAIVAAWRTTGTVCAVGYQWRSLDLLAELRSLLRGAQPGLLVSRSYGATEAARQDLHEGSWFTDPRASGGILFELASHDIDLQIALAGPVEWVHASAQSGLLALSGLPGSELDDAVSVVLGFAGGGLGAVSVAWSLAAVPSYSLDVHAAGVALSVALEPLRQIRGRAHGADVAFDGASGARDSSLRRFLESVRSGDPAASRAVPRTPSTRSRAVLACEQAIATGERVTL